MNENQEKKPNDEYYYPPEPETKQDKTYGKIISQALSEKLYFWIKKYYEEQDKIYPYQEQVYHKKYQCAKRGFFSKKENEDIIKAHEKQEKDLLDLYKAIENCRNTCKKLTPAKEEDREKVYTAIDKMKKQSMQDFINEWRDK